MSNVGCLPQPQNASTTSLTALAPAKPKSSELPVSDETTKGWDQWDQIWWNFFKILWQFFESLFSSELKLVNFNAIGQNLIIVNGQILSK